MRHLSERKRRRVPLTPLIDVVFLLLIFFVMAGRFADETRLVLHETPGEAPTQQSAEPPPMMLVNVDPTGALELAGKPIEIPDLAVRKPDDASVVLRLAPDMPLDVMVRVIDALKEAGIEQLSYWPEAGS